MNRFDVLLHLDVCREANCIDESVLTQAWIDGIHFGGAEFTPEAVATVLAILVSNKVGRRLEASIAWQASETVDLVTGKGLLVQMHELDVSVESVLLAEGLVAGREAGAGEFGLGVLVRLLVLFQALGCMEAFVTVWPVTDIVSNIIVFGFDVVLQVALTEESLVTALLRTSKGAIVGVRAFVFLETDGARVGLGAAFKVAGVFVLTRIGLSFG